MGTRRTLIIIVAVVFAVAAAFGSYAYLNSVQDRAYEDAELVRVFVVKQVVPKGSSGEQALSAESIKRDQIPREFRPNTALRDLASIRGKVAVVDLAPGQVVVDGMFVDPNVAQVTLARRIPPGRVTVTIAVDNVRGVGGNLFPNDKVNLLVLDSQGQDRVLYQNVEILAIGGQAAPQPGETQAQRDPTSGVITFSVPADAASRIVRAARVSGGIYLSLVPPDNQPAPIPPITDGNLFNVPLTPYG